MTGLPILSVMTWAPFIAALIVMAFARHRPLLVRWTSLIGASVSLVASIWVYWAYDRSAAGFQFKEQFDLVPSLGIPYLLAIDGMTDSMAFAKRLVEEAKVGVAPGIAFGAANDKDNDRFIRICFAQSSALLEEALGRLAKAL